MKAKDIHTSIATIAGVGPALESRLAKLGIFSVGDALLFFPKNYEDRTRVVMFGEASANAKVHCRVRVLRHEWFGYGRMKTLKLIVSDGERNAELVAFNRAFLEKQFPVGSLASLTGSFEFKYGALQSTSFELLKLGENESVLPDTKVFPIYSLTDGVSQKQVRKIISLCLHEYARGIENEIPDVIIEKKNLLSKQDALFLIHEPKTIADVEAARHTLIYEELFLFQCAIAKRAWEHKGFLPKVELSFTEKTASGNESERSDGALKSQADKCENFRKCFEENLSPLQKQLYKSLPFTLTISQMQAISEMNDDIDKGYRERASALTNENENRSRPVFTMQRLLHGDVGSGKTIVAFFVCLRVINWKGQCAFMAPTELLARQHAEKAANLFAPLGIRVAFLSGNLKARGRKALLSQLKNGNIDIVIGTHALFSRDVEYNDLQCAVIDEQHRFGVLQRESILQKGRNENGARVHVLLMSATPIPQTLALTVFGDLDVSALKTKPANRKAVATFLVKEGNERNAYEAVRKELCKGRQAYFVYHLIDGGDDENNFPETSYGFSYETARAISNETSQLSYRKNAGRKTPTLFSSTEKSKQKSASQMFLHLQKNIYPEYKCALIHSRIDEGEQLQIIRDFRDGKISVLAATTVIEVGIDVPNATCMVIENADSFGLAQLHQMRGRVGRGSEQSFCFLIYGKNISETGIARMKALRESNDGFFIAEQDLRLRGPGEITGTLQAGNLQLGIADIHRDREILLDARKEAFEFMRKKLGISNV